MLAWSGFIYAKIAKNAKFVEMSEDRKYLNGLANGSREAFEALYLRYAPLVERFVSALVKDSVATDDITQNIFMNLWNRRQNLDKEISFRSYIFTSSRNAVYDWFRRRDKLEKVPIDSVDLSGVPTADVNKVMDDVELLTLVNLAISNMPPTRKEIFTLSRVKGMKNAEIAELLGVSVKTVEYNIRRALEELRKLTYIILLFI